LFLIEYGRENKTGGSSSTIRIDYCEILSEQDYAFFDKLRQLRKEIAEKQGVPVYAVLLFRLTKATPSTLPAPWKKAGSL
jgi:superfamily II DNA helicase RecQ